jgi:demethylmenaquinone methyltransferase/2-methoxy-6-polyprenyl-1,4-benzoquinol methylase
MSDLSTTFGTEQVSPAERERRIRDVFDGVAPRYDLMNDLMSMGIHRLWKRTLARRAALAPGEVAVDLAGGTGDVARLMAGPERRVVVLDPSLPMMAVGRSRGVPAGWLGGSGEALPVADGAADVVTIAFGIRNVTHMDRVFAEVLRVLRPGGRFLCLEFSRPFAPIRPFYQAYSRLVIPRLGAAVARNPGAYQYLIESIRRFPDQKTMQAAMQQAGFADVGYRNLSLGIACIHWGQRPTGGDGA